MEKPCSTLIVFLSSLLFLLPGLAKGEEISDLKQGLVRITAETQEGTRITVGAGTILELKSDFALILTAASVVAGRHGLAAELASEPDKPMSVTFVKMEGGEPHGVTVLFVEGDMLAHASALALAGHTPVPAGATVVSPRIPEAGQEWTLVEGQIADRKGRALRFSHNHGLTQAGGPLIKDGQVIGVITEVTETSAYATPALLASYVLESWGVMDRQQTQLAGVLAAESIALLHQVEHRTPGQVVEKWWRLIKEEARTELLRRSLLLALESLRRSPSINARKALRSGLALLAYPVIDTDPITMFTFSPDGQYLVTVYDPDKDLFEFSGDNVVRIWEVATGKEAGRLWPDSVLTSIRFSPDGKYLATGTKAGTVRLWAMETHQQAAELVHDDPVRSLAFTPDGGALLTMTGENASTNVYLWDVATGSKRLHLDQPGIASFVLGPRGKYLAARSESGRGPGHLWIWELSTGKELLQAQFESGPAGIAISADGQYLAASFSRNSARIWSLGDGQELNQIPSVGGALAFSPDGRYLAIGFSVWDLSRVAEGGQLVYGDRLHTLTHEVSTARYGHEDDVIVLLFSPDGRYLASGSQDRTARVLALSSGEEVARFTLANSVYGVIFSPNGQYLSARALSSERFRLWLVWPDDPVSEACRRVRRNLTYVEWRRYIGDEPYRKTCEDQP